MADAAKIAEVETGDIRVLHGALGRPVGPIRLDAPVRPLGLPTPPAGGGTQARPAVDAVPRPPLGQTFHAKANTVVETATLGTPGEVVLGALETGLVAVPVALGRRRTFPSDHATATVLDLPSVLHGRPEVATPDAARPTAPDEVPLVGRHGGVGDEEEVPVATIQAIP